MLGSAAMLPLEGTLVERLRKLEALHAGTKYDGEREAARRAAEKIRARLAELRGHEADEVFRYSLPDPWTRKLFLALCRRYGLKPYREPGQRYSSVQVRAPESFQNKTLWPEFQALRDELVAELAKLTAYSARPGRRFRCDLGSGSDPPGRSIGAQRRVGGQVDVEVASEPIPFFLRIEGPRSATTCALWTRRSQIASAIVGSPNASCQLFVGSWEVITVEQRS